MAQNFKVEQAEFPFLALEMLQLLWNEPKSRLTKPSRTFDLNRPPVVGTYGANMSPVRG